ncbi:methylated-DNA--[protein]-cysteine S-methyltransferase [Ramlibacter sp.]|uniref:methylated-DNA--[protein]-cysteine S-methyltransferase n=1 Tax=Ramlibacter sp. TaxID=1917967 RepID=UPI002B8F7038|nr:methylated-DNA--[protein]-cysteine S-methyltransferase [Ramlibacter sp.]HWI81252.1 methylated-DNA--[protein]-cysteine S-methyltransferase [Ramlibacter sp.]
MDSGWCLFDTAIGPCGIAWGEQALVGVQLPEGSAAATRACMRRRFPRLPECAAPARVAAIVARVQRWLEGGHDAMLDVALDMSAVPEFHQRVYQVTRAIAPGHTLSYGEVAARIGEPGAARAVGQALGRNPFAPIVPCHRVLAARTGAGGFSADGGVATKLRLLEIERAQLGSEPGLFD